MTDNRQCDVCEARPATWRNESLLGSNDNLCMTCFGLWYERGMTNRVAIRSQSLRELEMGDD